MSRDRVESLHAPRSVMPALRDIFAGPWRAVLVLGVTQILAWGAIFYPPVLTVPLIAAERGWSMTFAMGGFSLALLTAGLASPRVGLMIDRHGGHRVMSVGSLLGALGLLLIVYADHPVAYLAVWMLLGVAIAASLYDPAFATLGRIFGAAARRRSCLDGELADHSHSARSARMARRVSRLCRAAGLRRRAAARLRVAAHARRSHRAGRRTGAS